MAHPTKPEIEAIFTDNLARVRGLVTAYDHLAGGGSGRSTVAEADLLRAAVVFLHAALEDLLRSTLELRLPAAAPAAFERVQLAPLGLLKDSREKFTLVDLANYRGQSVDDVFRAAIDGHLDHSSYNGFDEVVAALRRVGVTFSIQQGVGGALESMMKRRHWIAHRADRNPMTGSGHHSAQSIGRSMIQRWIVVVEAFGNDVLTRI